MKAKFKHILKRVLVHRTKEEIEFRRLSTLPRFQLVETTLNDKLIKVPDAPSFLFMKEEIFNKEIYRFQSNISDPYIIDGGANIGLSVIYFKHLFPKARIIAFEPDPKIFSILKFNVEAFGFKNVILVNKGLWNSETVLKFDSEGADAGKIIQGEEESSSCVEVTTLSKYINEQVDFLKLDIEGSESVVIPEVGEKLKLVRNMFVEYHSVVKQPQYLPELLSHFKNAGFRFHITAPGLVSRHPFVKLETYADMDNQLNIFCFRED